MSAKSKTRTSKNKQKGNRKAEKGFLPCFSKYLFDKYPIDNAYQNKTFIDKVGKFLSIMMTTPNPSQLKDKGACHKTMLLDPKDHEGRRVISECSWEKSLIYRAGFGDNKMRIIFGIESSKQICYIFALDANHSTFDGKNKG